MESLLKGNPHPKWFDIIIAVYRHTEIFVLESIGNQTALGNVWLYEIKTGSLIQIASIRINVWSHRCADSTRQWLIPVCGVDASINKTAAH